MEIQKVIEILKDSVPDCGGYSLADVDEAFEMAISALEKQIPKKPKSEKEQMLDNFSLDWFDYIKNYCPNCSKEMPESSRTNKRCPYCGQAIDLE